MTESSLFENMLPPLSILKEKVREWIREDVPSFDIGAAVVGDRTVKATLYFKAKQGVERDKCLLAGTTFFDVIMRECGVNDIEWLFQDGDIVQQEDGEVDINVKDTVLRTTIKMPVAHVEGSARQILQAERVALNVLSRCSSIATSAYRFRSLKEKHGFKGEISATRKTTPGFKLVEKYGVIVGGCSAHRYDVSQMVMLKDNHLDAYHGNIEAMIASARRLGGFSTMIEVECRSQDMALRAARAGAHIIMLDNFSAHSVKDASARLKKQCPSVVIETSGGLTLDNASDFFDDNIDVLSTSQLLYGQTASPIDFSLKVED